MENIKEALLGLKNKLDQISDLPNPQKSGNDFVGLDFDEGHIYYKTETYFRGCGSESFTMVVAWDEIHKPLEHFRDKF